jgi:hypothetical protein
MSPDINVTKSGIKINVTNKADIVMPVWKFRALASSLH